MLYKIVYFYVFDLLTIKKNLREGTNNQQHCLRNSFREEMKESHTQRQTQNQRAVKREPENIHYHTKQE